jgi:hypothetical protein
LQLLDYLFQNLANSEYQHTDNSTGVNTTKNNLYKKKIYFPIMSNYANGVKKVPFDGTKESFYQWTRQLLGFAETYDSDQALLGNLIVPAASMALDPTTAAHKKLLDARKANSTAMCLLRISLSDKISQSALYNSKTTDLLEVQLRKHGIIYANCSTLSMSIR